VANKQSASSKARAKGQDVKGRAKEAAGAVTDDESLRAEGRTEQAGAQAKEAVEKVAGGARDVVDKGVDKVRGLLRRGDRD
jgi:uncharacterized protein YjbJ (UPF0337 family)